MKQISDQQQMISNLKEEMITMKSVLTNNQKEVKDVYRIKSVRIISCILLFRRIHK
jgi:hypothetical protein